MNRSEAYNRLHDDIAEETGVSTSLIKYMRGRYFQGRTLGNIFDSLKESPTRPRRRKSLIKKVRRGDVKANFRRKPQGYYENLLTEFSNLSPEQIKIILKVVKF